MKLNIISAIAVLMIGYTPTANAFQGDTSIQQEAVQIAGKVADKLIRDTRFEFKWVPQKEELGMQVIDFGKMLTHENEVANVRRQARVAADTVIHFGVSGAGKITIWLNDQLVFQQDDRPFIVPREIAYNRFTFSQGFDANCKKGDNEIRIRYASTKARSVVFLRPQLPNGDLNTAISFKPLSPSERPIQRLLPELRIDSSTTYQRDPYADWHYANGNTVWSVMNLAKATGDQHYLDFVKKYTGFIIQNSNYFQKQYDSLFAFRGSFHRLFRLTMLDDAGSAVLPFIQLYLAEKDTTLQHFIAPIADYVSNRQVRLKDGTFCRPEPVEFTVWADDLFMSVPFLLRLGEATGQQKYYDDATRQFVNFRKYLLDPATGLYRHGWFSATQQQSPVCWGRANGWMAWATVELLSGLPKHHPAYPAILAACRQQMATLVKYQAKDGMWHQVLDRADSYEETSCTAIFTGVLARAVREGWIDRQYRVNALNGWKAVKSKIEADGTVHGICRGTEIGADQQYYFNRPTVDQDPRGLGAVITAGIEIAQLR